MSATVPTKAAFDALEARVVALEQHGSNPGPLPPIPEPPNPNPPSGGSNPNAPPEPPKPDIMPGTSGRVLSVGPGTPYGTVAEALTAAQDGDTIQLKPNTPRQSFRLNKSVLLDGGGNRWDFNGVPANQLFQSKGGIVVQDGSAAAWHIKNFTIVGCGRAEKTHSLIAGIRCSRQSRGIVENCTLSGNQNGFAADGNLGWMIELRDVELENNGIGDGLTHNLYCNNGHTLKLVRVNSRTPNGGHAIKCRAFHTQIEESYFLAAETPLDMPNGGMFRVSKTTLAKVSNTNNRRFLSYGVEYQTGGMFDDNRLDGCTMDLPITDPFVQTEGGTITFAPDCTWKVGGGKVTIFRDGPGKVIGLPA
jgi:hypothetical protein